MCVWLLFYEGSKLRWTTVRHVTSIGPSITSVPTVEAVETGPTGAFIAVIWFRIHWSRWWGPDRRCMRGRRSRRHIWAYQTFVRRCHRQRGKFENEGNDESRNRSVRNQSTQRLSLECKHKNTVRSHQKLHFSLICPNCQWISMRPSLAFWEAVGGQTVIAGATNGYTESW